MQIKRIMLMPGVYFTGITTDKFKTSCLSLNLLRPLCNEEASLNALLPDVLLRGCELCPDMGEISTWLDERYGAGVQATVRKKGEVQAIGFFMDYIDEKFAFDGEDLTKDMCELLGSFLLHPVTENGVFRMDFVEGEKVNLVNAIMSQINDKRTYASMRLRQEMFRNEAYGVSKNGSVEAGEAITPDGLFAHYQKILSASQVEILYTGRRSLEDVKESLLEALGELPRGEMTPVKTELGTAPEAVREVTEAMDVTQGKLVMGFRAGITSGDSDYPAFLLMNGIFGGGLTSKLFMNVREKLSLCYYASSGIDRFKGVMVVSSGVDAERFETAKDEILRQLEATKAGDITSEELEAARIALISGLKTSGDSPYNMDDFYLGQVIGGFDYSPEELSEKLRGLTVEDITRVASKVVLDTVYFLRGDAV